MIDLEQEFEQLKRMVLKTISDKEASGELTGSEASELYEMVMHRMRDPNRAWNTSGCADGSDYEEDGWYSSNCEI